MREKIDCFLPCADIADLAETIGDLSASKTVQHIHLLTGDATNINNIPQGVELLETRHPLSTDAILQIAERTDAEYVLISTKPTPVRLGQHSLERFLRVAADANAAMVYSDHYSVVEGTVVRHPVIDYQKGSVRDDFDFGQIVLVNASLLHEYAATPPVHKYAHAGLYDLRLFLSRKGEIFHINEYLYTEEELDNRKSGEKQFDYVNPRNRAVQEEMEHAVTHHLAETGAIV